MSRSKTCEHCVYFYPNDTIPPQGMCKRFPPVPMIMQQPANILGAGGIGMAGVNPPVDADNTCGEFKDAKPLALAS
ncbi:MAG: hypothetical protein IIA11_02660 [Proteobacteria bacterium]|nr:hypothetical protein [Pseudomonadota bacterium]